MNRWQPTGSVTSTQRRKVTQQAKYARRRGADSREVINKDLARLLRSDCLCGRPGTQLDHVIPLSRGGRHSIGNLQMLCQRCNGSKATLLMIEWRHGGYSHSRKNGLRRR